MTFFEKIDNKIKDCFENNFYPNKGESKIEKNFHENCENQDSFYSPKFTKIFCRDSLKIPENIDLLDIQKESFRNYITSGFNSEKGQKLSNLFKKNFPIKSSDGRYELRFIDYNVGYPKNSTLDCMKLGTTYSVPLRVKFKLIKNNQDALPEEIDQEIYLGNIPYMTESASFIINGIERVMVSLISKSGGIFFSVFSSGLNNLQTYSAKIIPTLGSWIEFTVSANGILYVYIDKKKKILFSTLFRALGFDSDLDILSAFNLCLTIKNTQEELNKYIGSKLMGRIVKKWLCEVVDEFTGEIKKNERAEVLLERGSVINSKTIPIILDSQVDYLAIFREENDIIYNNIIYKTLQKDNSNSTVEAALKLYKKIKGVEFVSEESVIDFVQGLFFNESKYSLGEVGRYKLNKKLGLNIPLDKLALTIEDIISIVKYLICMINTKNQHDDIDNLSNRRIKNVGENFGLQFDSALYKLKKFIEDKFNSSETDILKISELINGKIISNTMLNIFHSTNSLSQYMDQINPISEISHKRRISAIGQSGFSKDTKVGFEVRGVHYSYESKICPIETPEGASIGLITHFASFVKLNSKGFLESPYRKVTNGVVDISGNYEYLAVEDKDLYNIAQSTIKIDEKGKILENKVKVINKENSFIVTPDQVHYVHLSSCQIVSIPSSLIPFLEHNDPSRALMGANMQKQAVPLIKAQAPIVGTGMEKRVAENFGGLIYAENDGEVIYVDSKNIKIKYFSSKDDDLCNLEDNVKSYELLKYHRTNHKTCINYTPIVKLGQKVKKGDCLIEGYSTDKGELALGTNLVVAFSSKLGYTFEDSILISENLVRQDRLTSIFIEEYTLDLRDTKLGPEEFTSEIPNLDSELIKNLDSNGIAKVGTVVREGDILIGKLVPKNDGEPTPDQRILKALFGNKSGEVRDESQRFPLFTEGVVIRTKMLERKRKQGLDIEEKEIYDINLKNDIKSLVEKYKTKLIELRNKFLENFYKIVSDSYFLSINHEFYGEIIASNSKLSKSELSKILFPSKILGDSSSYKIIEEYDLLKGITTKKWIENEKKNELIVKLIDNFLELKNKYYFFYLKNKDELEVGDELPIGVIKRAKVYVAQMRKVKEGDKMSGRYGNKGVVSKILKPEDMPFLSDGTPVDIVLNPLGICSRMNIGQIFESALGMAGFKLNRKYYSPVFSGATEEDVQKELSEAKLDNFCKTDLYDGLTGEKLDNKVMVGVIYMLKLNHMVEDKAHAISTGNYSQITNQPLKGKSNRGGQRIGEMEVWALQAYGAAFILIEMITYKSDHIKGRKLVMSSIVKGENINFNEILKSPGQSFKVLVEVLRAIGLEVYIIYSDNENKVNDKSFNENKYNFQNNVLVHENSY